MRHAARRSSATHTHTGSTDTSLWTHYKAGAREYCGNAFPDGMLKNQRLAANVITPTTKSEVGLFGRGDVPLGLAGDMAPASHEHTPS